MDSETGKTEITENQETKNPSITEIVVTDDKVTVNGSEMKNPPFFFTLLQLASKMSKQCVRDGCENTFIHGSYTPSGFLCDDCGSCFIDAFDKVDIMYETRSFFNSELQKFLVTPHPENYVIKKPNSNLDIINIYQFLTIPSNSSSESSSSDDNEDSSSDSK